LPLTARKKPQEMGGKKKREGDEKQKGRKGGQWLIGKKRKRAKGIKRKVFE